MDVTAKYELIGLMAYPIRHSLSPEMQNKALEKAGLPFTYMAFEVDNSTFANAIAGLKALKMRGTGVSMPNKQLACEYVDELTPAAKLVGAINTIVNDDGYLRGYNTDGTGIFAPSRKAVSISGVKPWYCWAQAARQRPLAPRRRLKASKKSNSLTVKMSSLPKRKNSPNVLMKIPTAWSPLSIWTMTGFCGRTGQRGYSD